MTQANILSQLGSAGVSTGFKNRIINGAMVIDQRNGGASVTPTDGQYTVDRWQAGVSQASKLTVQQNAGSLTPVSTTGFVNYLGVTSSSAYSVLTGDYFGVSQNIEGLNIPDLAWGTASAKTVTLSAWVYSSLTGTFGGSLRNSASTRSYPFTYSIPVANTWTQISVTIAGDTSGTWLTTNGVGIKVNFSLGSGATYSGTAGSWASANYVTATGATSVVGTNGATFYITGVQLEVGTTATNFDYRSYGTELALCQRYYELIYAGQGAVGAASSTVCFISGQFLVTKRAAPTMAGGTSIQVRMYASGTGATSYTGAGIAATNQSNINGYEVQVGGFTGISQGFGQVLSLATPYSASAEL